MVFGYNGRDGVITDANGLLYMRARYYSPELRRFINADIVPGEISNAITLNRYAYANGNPVSNIDPFGLSAERNCINQLDSTLNDIIDMLDSFNSHDIDVYKGSIYFGLAKYYFSVSTTFGNGKFDIASIVQGQYDSLKSMNWSKGDFSVSCSSDYVKIAYSKSIDDVSSISASVRLSKTRTINAEYTVTTKIDDKNSVSTTIGVEKSSDDIVGPLPKTPVFVPEKAVESTPVIKDNTHREYEGIYIDPDLAGVIVVAGVAFILMIGVPLVAVI